jgi:hypothetical protein
MHVANFDHKEWDRLNLQDYSEFSEKITECDQRELGDCTAGNWYYIPDEPVTNENGVFKVIYHGSWGNYNSPGASSYTYAELFDTTDPDDMEDFEKQKKNWENSPEWEEVDEDEPDEDDWGGDDDSEEDDDTE